MGITKQHAVKVIREFLEAREPGRMGRLLARMRDLEDSDFQLLSPQDSGEAIAAFVEIRVSLSHAGSGKMTARQVMSQPLPDMDERDPPRSSSSETTPSTPRTRQELRKWEGFEDEMTALRDSLDDTAQLYHPPRLWGVEGRTYAAAGDESEIRGPYVNATSLVNCVADSTGWHVELLGGGRSRSLSCTDCVVRQRAPQQHTPGFIGQGRSGVARLPGTGKRAGAEAEMPRKARRAAGGDRVEACVASRSTRAAAVGAITARAQRAVARDKQGSVAAPVSESLVGVGLATQPGTRGRGTAAKRSSAQAASAQGTGASGRQQGRQQGLAQGTGQAAKRAEDASARVLACVVVKGEWQWDLQPEEQLLEVYEQRPKKLLPAVNQLYGDMVMEQVAYGMLTRYKTSVLFKRDANVKNKVLYVSPTIGLDRLLLAQLLMAKLAWRDKHLKGVLLRNAVPRTPDAERRQRREQAGMEGGGKKGTKQGKQGRGQAKQQPQRNSVAGKRQGQGKGQKGRQVHEQLTGGCQGEVEEGSPEEESQEEGSSGEKAEESSQSEGSQQEEGSEEEEVEESSQQEEEQAEEEGSLGEEGCDALPHYTFSSLGITGQLAGHGRFGNVLKGSYDGKAAIVKLYHARLKGAEEAFWHELEMYRAFPRLHGKVVPMPLCHGILYPTDAFFLALSDEGEDLESLGVSISGQLYTQAREALEALHRAGICHGDVRAANLVLRGSGTVCVVDFEQAEVVDKLRAKQGRAMLQADMDSLEALRT